MNIFFDICTSLEATLKKLQLMQKLRRLNHVSLLSGHFESKTFQQTSQEMLVQIFYYKITISYQILKGKNVPLMLKVKIRL